MDILDGKTLDVKNYNLNKLREIFPEIFVENKVDFRKLMLILDEYVELEKERYDFSWNGKIQAIKLAQKQTTGTLRPFKEDSLNWDSTKNLYIQGDNLEVLRVLQNSYRKKVKVIYIDPPYNTGKDFIYKDDFHDNLGNYKKKNDENMKSNPETNGRYHTDWLNMIYPRLKIAKQLLKDDGVVFISIDEIEFPKLRMICDEIFGEENHIADFVWKNKAGGGNDAKHIAVEHEYILMYARNEVYLHALFEPYKPEYLKRYKEEDEKGKFYWDTYKRKSGKQYYPIECPDGSILEFDELGNPISWLRSKERFLRDLEEGEVRFVKKEMGWSVHFKQRLPKGKKPRSIFLEESIFDKHGKTSDGSSEILDLFGKNVFHNPKPVSLIKHLLGFSLTKNDIVLDFFSGSATTAQAIYEMNLEDNGHRRFILVQLEETIDFDKPEQKDAYEFLESINKPKKITEIGKERIRRVVQKIIKEKSEKELENLDLGFKVFYLDDTNLKKWDEESSNLEVDLLNLIDPVKKDRTQEDVVYEILLKYGIDLNVPIEKINIYGKKVYSVGMGFLLICLERELNLQQIEELAKQKPARIVFYDEGFEDDTVRTNAQQILKRYGVEDIRVI